MCGCTKRAELPRVIVLGIDGMDPEFVRRHWDQLPNLTRLRDEGGFQPLTTTIPPQSPVAWSTFITGRDPDSHGVFDFVHRNPRTLTIFSSLAESVEPNWKLPLGEWELPLSRGQVRSLRRGKAFWQTLSEAGVPVTVIRMPNNFPPVECEGLSLAGMGTPDLAGTFGTFTHFSSDPEDVPREVPGGRIVRASTRGNRVTMPLAGPANSLRRDRRPAAIEIEADVDPEHPVARFRAGGATVLLKEKEWSGWIRAKFDLLWPLASTAGMFRIYVRELHPHVRVYVSPINADPEDPAVPLSTPSSYSRELSRAVGPYYTQGIAEDTAALRAGVLSASEFVQQANLVADEHLKLLDHELKRFEGGLLFFHFFGADQISHMFWKRNEPEVLAMYRRVDAAIGRVAAAAPSAEVIVMSDHGFTSFDRSMHLNQWLQREGFLTRKQDAANTEGLEGIDWSRTQAYAVGLNALYLNLEGREKEGVVTKDNHERILESLRERLLAARDSEKEASPVAAVYRTKGAGAPDLIVGYAAGYRASWQTALGQAPEPVFEDNTDAWIGDHCVAAHLVPGVFASNRKFDQRERGLADITALIRSRFGLPPVEKE